VKELPLQEACIFGEQQKGKNVIARGIIVKELVKSLLDIKIKALKLL
jgi:hypothetical protein